MPPFSVSIFGDSILKGVLFQNGRYEVNHRWEESFAETFAIPVLNRSRFGNTIRKALPGLKKHCESEAGNREYALLELGGNDCDYDWAAIAAAPGERHRCKTPAEVFIASYRDAVGILRDSGRIPVAITLPPVLPERFLDFICSRGLSRDRIMQWLGDTEEIDRWQKTYSSLVRQIAREEQVQLIDLRSAYPEERTALRPLIGVDGIHPSASGQELIYRLLCRKAAECLPLSAR